MDFWICDLYLLPRVSSFPTSLLSPSAASLSPRRVVWPLPTFSTLTAASIAARHSTSPGVSLQRPCWRSQTVSNRIGGRAAFIPVLSILSFSMEKICSCIFFLHWSWLRFAESHHPGVRVDLGLWGEGFQEMLFAPWAQNALFPWWPPKMGFCPHFIEYWSK